MGMFFDLIPIVVAWGTLALIIATYTPVFDWISYPMGMYLKLLGSTGSICSGTGYPGRIYRYVHPGTPVGGTDICKDKIRHRSSFTGTDHLSDRSWNDYYQE